MIDFRYEKLLREFEDIVDNRLLGSTITKKKIYPSIDAMDDRAVQIISELKSKGYDVNKLRED